MITCFPEGAHNRGFPSNPTVQTTSPSLDESWPWCGCWWFVSLAPQILLFHIIAQYPLLTACHNLFLKQNIFILFQQRITYRNMVKKVFFSLNLCETQTLNNQHIQAGANDFQCFLWIFWVCWLSPMWYNVVCSQLMSQFDGYQLQLVYPTVEHRPARTLQQGTSQTFDMFNQSRHFLHTTHKSFFFFAFQLHFYLS